MLKQFRATEWGFSDDSAVQELMGCLEGGEIDPATTQWVVDGTVVEAPFSSNPNNSNTPARDLPAVAQCTLTVSLRGSRSRSSRRMGRWIVASAIRDGIRTILAMRKVTDSKAPVSLAFDLPSPCRAVTISVKNDFALGADHEYTLRA